MWTKQRRRTHTSRFILPLLSFGIVSYFVYHIYHGQYGLHSHENLNNQIRLLETELHGLEAIKEQWKSQVSLLKDGSIEKDMLEEYARRNLNVARSNELIILESEAK